MSFFLNLFLANSYVSLRGFQTPPKRGLQSELVTDVSHATRDRRDEILTESLGSEQQDFRTRSMSAEWPMSTRKVEEN